MTLRRPSRRIDPIDLSSNSSVGVGVKFPFDGPAVFNQTFTTKEQIKSNLINLLLTHPGERINEPEFGVGIRDLLFEQQINTADLKSTLNEEINIHIPEITLNDIDVSFDPNTHIVSVVLYYQILLDESKEVIQINFNGEAASLTEI
jgi:phage baseplate assembly protein W